MKLIRKLGSTSNILQVFVADSSSTTGAGLTGLVFNTSSLTAYYHRDTDTTATAITLVTMTVGTFTSSGFKEIDAANMPGWYQFCPPDAAIAAGAKSVAFHLKGATNMAPLPIEIDLDAQVDVTSWNGTAVSSPATAGIPDVNAKNINNVAAATPGASGGLLIAGSNAATTFSGLTTGALSCTTITASGAVAFQSTFAVTTSTSLAALSATTITASGLTSLAAVSTSGTLTLNALTVTNNATVSGNWLTSGTTTLTGAVTASNASNNIVGIDVAKISGDATAADNLELFYDGTGYNAANSTVGNVTLAATVTTLTNLPAITTDWLTGTGVAASAVTKIQAGLSTLTQTQVTGGAYALNNASFSFNSGLDFTSTQKAATLARVTLTDTVTTYTGNTPQTGDAYARIGATGSGLTSLAPSSTALSTAQWTGARAGYLDNVNVGGAVASQADVNALNQSASRRVVLVTTEQYERPESGNSSYQLELRTYDGDGAAVNADTTPTLTAAGVVSGNLSANLSSATNPAAGVYRWTYTVSSSAALEQVRFDASAAISSSTFTIAAFAQILDLVGATWTSTDAANLTAIFNKLPVNNIADQTLLNTAVAGVQSDTDNIQTRLPAALIGGRIDATVGAMQAGTLTAAAVASGALNGKGDWLLSSSYTTPPTAASISSTVWAETTRVLTAGTNIVLAKGAGITGFNDIAAADVWAAGTRTLTAFSFTVALTSAYDPAKTAAQAGDAMSLTAGTGSALVAATTAAVAAQVTTDHGSGSYIRNTEPPAAAAIAVAVVDQTLSGHTAPGTAGEALAAASSSGDPWTVELPGIYVAGTAGNIIGTLIDAAVSSRLAAADYTAPDNPTDYARNDVAPDWYSSAGLTAEEVWAYPDRTLAAAALDAVLVAANLTEGRFADSNGAPLTQLNLRQAIALLLSYSAGDRTGVGTREIIAALAGDTTQIKATRVSQTAIEGSGIVPV